MTVLAWAGALAIGLTLGLLGSGGSILTVPVLVYLVGEPDKVAIAESLAIVGLIAAFGALPHARRGVVSWSTVLLFGLPGMAGSYVGALAAKSLPGHVQLTLFAMLMLIAALSMLRPSQAPASAGAAGIAGGAGGAAGPGGMTAATLEAAGLIDPCAALPVATSRSWAQSAVAAEIASAASAPALAGAPVGADGAVGAVASVGSAPPAAAPVASFSSPAAWTQYRVVIIQGFGVGTLTGLVGVGGGFLVIPALVLVLGLPMHVAIGTSLSIVALNSATGFYKHAQVLTADGHTLNAHLIGSFAIVGIAGSLTGSMLCHYIPQRQLRRIFAVFVIVIGAFLLWKNLHH